MTAPAPLSRRFRVYPRIIVAGYVIAFVIFVATTGERARQFIVPDYVAFYVASELAAEGQLAAAFDLEVSAARQAALTGGKPLAPWFYPPTYNLFIFWLPLLPYYMGVLLFVTATLALFALSVRGWLCDRDDLWLLLASPAVFINAFHGQNGFLTGALIAIAMNFLWRRQVVAGVALGLLSIKPHLGLLVPVGLVLYRRWAVLATALGTTAALIALSLAIHGPDPWQAFFEVGLQGAGGHLSQGTLPITMNASAFAALRLAGVPDRTAIFLHLLVLAAVAAMIVYLARIGVRYRFVMAFLLATTLLVSPHNFVYDWVLVLIPLLILWRQGRMHGFLRYEKAALFVCYVAPFVIVFTRNTGVPTAFLLILVPIALTLRRALRDAATAAPPQRLPE